MVPESNLSLLSVSPLPQDHHELLKSLAGSAWLVFESDSLRSALAILRQNRIPVVVCACEAGMESWRSLLEQLATFPHSPYLIVTSRQADDSLWSEVLNAGAYDLLAKPFQTRELQRTLFQAWSRWQQHVLSVEAQVPGRARAATA